MVIKGEYVNIKGSKIHYLEIDKESSKDTVILLHGKRYNAYDWINSGIAENLSNQGFKVICFEFPGYGSSEECRLDEKSHVHVDNVGRSGAFFKAMVDL